MFNFLRREPINYPRGTLTEEQVVAKVLEYRKKGLKPFKKVLGSLATPFERKGVETPNRNLRLYSEFSGFGSFSYLIIDGHDCIDVLRNVEVYPLVHEGVIVEPQRFPSLYERWRGLFETIETRKKGFFEW